MKSALLLFGCSLTLACGGGGKPAPITEELPAGDDGEELAGLYQAYEAELEPAYVANQLAWWAAANHGRPEQFAELTATELRLRELDSDPETFARLGRLRQRGRVTDPIARRLLDLLYLGFEENQIPPALQRQLVTEANSLEQTFNTFRAEVDGEKVTANKVGAVLLDSDDSAERRKYWQASKQIGPAIADRVVALVKQRNLAARLLGYPDYYQMRLALSEQRPAEIAAIFDAIDEATAEPFAAAKAELDRDLARRFGISPAELRPWHYGDVFFQEPPRLPGLDLDAAFSRLDTRAVVTEFYTSIGMPVTEILDRSDLYERAGKVEHAFCADIDRKGDIRVLANLQPDERWTATLLHELGHGVYDQYIDRELPFLMRKTAHQLTSEGVANLFGALTRDPSWLATYTPLPRNELARLTDLAAQEARLGYLIFSRWSLVLVNFERQLYADPDQDLNQLWWRLVSRYQLLTPPDDLSGRADWAAKIHVVTVPAYYHNYLLGDLFAAQLRAALAERFPAAVTDGRVVLAGHPEIGEFLIRELFAPGRKYRWNDLVVRVTGEPLSPAAFLAELSRQ